MLGTAATGGGDAPAGKDTMQLCKIQLSSGAVRPAILDDGLVRLLTAASLADILHAPDLAAAARAAVDAAAEPLVLKDVTLLAPLDRQEIGAAGVTYKRSKVERERESAGAAQFYDFVYTAERPELFFKAPAWRVIGPGGRLHIRRDSRWS